MTNSDKYAGATHSHYVFERMCPKCHCFVCGREPSDFRECLIKDVHDYRDWLLQEADDSHNEPWIMRMYHKLKGMLKG